MGKGREAVGRGPKLVFAYHLPLLQYIYLSWPSGNQKLFGVLKSLRTSVYIMSVVKSSARKTAWVGTLVLLVCIWSLYSLELHIGSRAVSLYHVERVFKR